MPRVRRQRSPSRSASSRSRRRAHSAEVAADRRELPGHLRAQPGARAGDQDASTCIIPLERPAALARRALACLAAQLEVLRGQLDGLGDVDAGLVGEQVHAVRELAERGAQSGPGRNGRRPRLVWLRRSRSTCRAASAVRAAASAPERAGRRRRRSARPALGAIYPAEANRSTEAAGVPALAERRWILGDRSATRPAARRRRRLRPGRQRARRGARPGRARGRRGQRRLGRSPVRRAERMLPGVAVLPPDEVVAAADFVLLAVPDDALRPLVAGLADTGAWRARAAGRAHLRRAGHRRARPGRGARRAARSRCTR